MLHKIRLVSILWIASIALALPSCQGQVIKEAGPAFYYWKTTLQFDTTDAGLADQMRSQHFYLRYFDVDWSAGYTSAVPTGVLEIRSAQGWDKKTVTPTVYITNRTFTQIKEQDIPVLASKVARKIAQINEDLEGTVFNYSFYDHFPERLTWEERSDIIDSLKRNWSKKIVEIQIDCDWTLSTRDKYFSFLKFLQESAPDFAISSTLRLHQYRDRATMGVPPVKKVMLMCYNTGDPKKASETNAILDASVVKQYLKGKKYPLEMEVALPQFNWGAWYRAGVFQGLLRDLSPETPGTETYLQKEQDNQYRVKQDTVIRQDYLREGDLIRMDGSTPEQMQETLKVIKEKLRGRISKVAFFDWEYRKIKENQASLQAYFNGLKKN
ncbi:MAG: hypothetical protein SFV55_02735 [Haliscomenobacter sp.]|uniref:hypothetical protein n=1 Tax=Haliscomenobacter sp. TaxID=2717303 RepID=UPI0029BDA5D1|nr:hypothetical protein [Haliscomenobacter sp.]MDX2067311.1 hypothetical protein [Haliscomenobacter sp.]